MKRRYVLLALDGFNALKEPIAGGCTGARSGPLAKMCGSTTHILRST
ncbi:MAG: NAD(P)-binding domain-containing protein [Sphingomonadales bacterium]